MCRSINRNSNKVEVVYTSYPIFIDEPIYHQEGNYEGEYDYEEQEEQYEKYYIMIVERTLIIYTSSLIIIIMTTTSSLFNYDSIIINSIIDIYLYSTIHTFMNKLYRKYTDLANLYRVYLLNCLLLYKYPFVGFISIGINAMDKYFHNPILEIFINIYGNFMGKNIYLYLILWINYVIIHYITHH